MSIRITDLSIRYGEQVIFSHFNLAVPDGEYWALLGRSGIGKSTLIYAIANLLTEAKVTGAITDENGQAISHHIAWLAQKDSLLPWLSVIDNVRLSDNLTRPLFARKSLRDKAMSLLEQVGLTKYADAYPDTLSGGQRQRVALARTLFSDKPIILMDEPFSALDVITKLELQDLTAQLLKGKTVIHITHDPLEALRLADAVIVLQGQPAESSQPIRLVTPSPRNVEDETILSLQGQLLQLLKSTNLAQIA